MSTKKPATKPAAAKATKPAATKPAAATKPEKPAKPAKVVKDKVEQNGIIRPSAGTTTGRIWEIADGLSAKTKAPAVRKDVMAQADAEKINAATAATQYGKWRKFNGLEGRTPAAAKPAKAKGKAAA